VKRKFRLARSTEIKRVRRAGKNYAHPLLAFYILRSHLPYTRICIVAGSGIGNAVVRNRAKRRIRAAVQPMYSGLISGFDIMIIARKAIVNASWNELTETMNDLAARAGLLMNPVDDGN
jgi:ribonuclease P protein component